MQTEIRGSLGVMHSDKKGRAQQASSRHPLSYQLYYSYYARSHRARTRNVNKKIKIKSLIASPTSLVSVYPLFPVWDSFLFFLVWVDYSMSRAPLKVHRYG